VADPRHAVMVVGGGRWHHEFATGTAEEPFPDDGKLFVAIARALRSTVVVLGQVPFQPLFDLTEDRLIAHSFERYLATGDPEWPLLLPMVKSVVRALDASSEAAAQQWGAPLERFTVTGGSKRGWTTWLTAAVDPRVTAIAPISSATRTASSPTAGPRWWTTASASCTSRKSRPCRKSLPAGPMPPVTAKP